MFNKLFTYLKNNWKGVILGALSAIVFLYFFTNRVEVSSTMPVHGAMNVDLNTNITLVFNANIKKEDISIDSFPQEDFILEQIDKRTVNLTHQYSLYQATLYTTKIYYKGTLLKTLNFTTAKAENNPRELQIMDQEIKENYPLADKLPLSKQNYRVVYQAPLTLEVELYEEDLDQSQITRELILFMQSEGLSADSHTIIFKLPKQPAPTTYR